MGSIGRGQMADIFYTPQKVSDFRGYTQIAQRSKEQKFVLGSFYLYFYFSLLPPLIYFYLTFLLVYINCTGDIFI
jgi:hypothetical protein